MPRNAVLVRTRFFSGLATVLAVGLLSACAPGNAWNQPRASAPEPATTPPAVDQAKMKPPAPSSASRAAKVALLLPLSGKGSETGQAMLNAAQLAVFDLDAASFELIPRDTTGTTDGARNAAQAVLNEQAQLILGPVFAADAKAVIPVASSGRINVLSFSTDSSVASSGGFVMGFLPQTQITQILDYAASRKLQRIALIAPQDAYGDMAASTFSNHMRQRNLTSAGLIRFNGNTGPTPEQIQSLIAQAGATGGKPFDAVLIASSGPQANMASQYLTQAGLPPSAVQRLGTGLWDQADAAYQPSLQGAWYAASSPYLRQRFEHKYRQTYGEAAPRLATLAYDATALAIVLARTGQDYSRQTLTNVNGFNGIDGIFRLRQDGLIERGLAILEIRNNRASVIKDAPTSFQSFGG